MKTKVLGMLLAGIVTITRGQPIVPLVPASAVVQNTNSTYGLPLTWDAVTNAVGYRVYWGTNYGVYPNVTNVAGNFVVVRVRTNETPFLAVAAVDEYGLESALSAVLTRTNYVAVTLLGSTNMINWTPAGVNVFVNPTQSFAVFKQAIAFSNNWKTVP